jgi:hypothetical protein
MSIVISRIDAPFVTSMRMRDIADSISDWVSHVRVHMSHVNFHAEAALIFSEAPLTHAIE